MTEMVKAKLNGEFEIILPKHRADREQWYTEEGWEKARLQAMHEHIGKGDLVYYVGAEEGEMCALCSMWGANVLLFEPNDRVMPNIREIYKHNGLKPATIIRGFAGNETTGDIEFAYVDQIEGEVIGDHGFKELHDRGDIPVVKIDDLVYKLDFRPPTVITMDVEGSEWEVLQGAEVTIIDHKPLIFLSLHPEFLFRIYGKYSYEVRRWIIDKGYDEVLLDYQHEVHLAYYPKGDK